MTRTVDERDALASRVADGGEAVRSVAEDAGVCEQSVRNWVKDLMRRRSEEAEREEARRRAMAVLTGGAGEVVLLEVETPAGRSLVIVDVARGGGVAGTVRRIAGAPVADGMPLGSVRRRWAVDAMALARALSASIAHLGEYPRDQRRVLDMVTAGRALGGGEGGLL